MKKNYLILLILFSISTTSFAQTIFWSEDFGTVCSKGTLANGYVTPNGTWVVTPTGLNDTECNKWYASATENGNGAGNCGSACGTNRTLHVGADDGLVASDPGAAYDAGGLCPSFACVSADARAESPVINCTGKNTITLSFNYMEFGSGTVDDATLWYFDGSAWAQIDPLAKTPCCGGACNGNRQGKWTAFSIALPTSANNNANVKIGFRWVNNDDGVGTDPSFAVDDIHLSVPAGTLPQAVFTSSDSVFCAESGSCIDFTDHSTGNPTSWKWSFPGALPDTSTLQNPTAICYLNAGTYAVTLIVTNANGTDTTTVSPMITVGATPPPPTLTFSGDTIFCSHASAYQWYFNGTLIPGAIDSFYIATTPGNYSVRITDANGCTRLSNGVLAAVSSASGGAGIWIYPNPAREEFTVYGLQPTVGTLEIYSAVGAKVYSDFITGKQKSVNSKQFSPGIYFVKVSSGEKQWMQKIVIE